VTVEGIPVYTSRDCATIIKRGKCGGVNRVLHNEILLGFTLGAKLVSSKHLTQVHLKISSLTLENLASHLMTKYIT